MEAGKLREWITVLTPAPGIPDGQGGTRPSTIPPTETELPARVVVLKGTAQLALGSVATGQVYTVTIRTNGPVVVTNGTRLRWNDTTLTVQSIAPAERRDLLALTCFDNGRG